MMVRQNLVAEGATPEIGFFASRRNGKISARRRWNFFLIHKIGGYPQTNKNRPPIFAFCAFLGVFSLSCHYILPLATCQATQSPS